MMHTNYETARPVLQHQRLMMTMMKMMIVMTTMVWTGTHAHDTTCTAVTTRASTTVKCHFGTDISKSKHDFNVQFYYPASTDNREMVLMCNAVPQSPDALKCHEASGVSFNKVVSEEITITRPPALDKVGGQYLCQLVPVPDQGDILPCNLTFQEIPTTQPAHPTEPGIPAENDSIISYLHGIVALTIVIPLILLLTCGLLLVIVYIKRERITNWWTQHTIGIARTEENMDPENNTWQNTSAARAQFPHIPQGWPAYFYNMGWNEGLRGEAKPNVQEFEILQEQYTSTAANAKDGNEGEANRVLAPLLNAKGQHT